MANRDGQRRIEEAVRGLAGRADGVTVEGLLKSALPDSGRGLQESVEELGKQLEQLRGASQAGADAIRENTETIRTNTTSRTSDGASGYAAEIARGAIGKLGYGMTLSPLLSGLLGLFRRPSPEAPPALIQYIRPPGSHYAGTAPREAGGPFLSVDYGTGDVPRVAPPAGPKAATHVTVEVRAMDSRSFLDHSDEIARAVRQAMLNAHSLNDVVSEL